MISQVSEKKMHLVRWLLALGWLTLIFSLFYDPLSAWATDLINIVSPSAPESTCVKVQSVCLPQHPYGIGARIFWGAVIPLAIIILLVFGHEFWRRICPLYFFSQIPRALGIQRKRKIVNPDTSNIRYELAGVEKESWLGRNHLYLQFALFYLGLNIRILFANGDRTALGIFLLLTIASAITVGFLFKGRSWCQYFCPMAPVQIFYTGPRGLLGSSAHLKPPQSITQSTCREVDSSGNEKSACVGCQSPCIDIDAERSYWEGITQPDQKLVFYGYFGLMLGFYFYYFLYSGNWDYYYSGAWTREEGQLRTLFNPGFYILNQAIPIPKLIAAPLTLAVFCAASYIGCVVIEKAYKAYLKRKNKYLNEEQVLNVLFVFCTFVSFNVLFIFSGPPNVGFLPWAILPLNTLIVIVSSIWLYRSLGRSQELYARENVGSSLGRQLNKLAVDWSKILKGRSIQNLTSEETYILTKKLPGFNHKDRMRVYQEVLREALSEGVTPQSLSSLQELRKQLEITDEEHYFVLEELGVEEPTLLNPQKQQGRENKLRLQGYRRALEMLILPILERGTPVQEAIALKQKQILSLRQQYAITTEEHQQVLAQMYNQNEILLRKAETQLSHLQELAVRNQILSNAVPNPQAPVYALLRNVVQDKQKLITTQLFHILEMLGDSPEAISIARAIGLLAANVIVEILHSHDEQLNWQKHLTPRVLTSLKQQESLTVPVPISTTTNNQSHTTFYNNIAVNTQLNSKRVFSQEAISDVLRLFLQDIDPVVQAASLYALHQFNPTQGFGQARQILDSHKNQDWLLQETAQRILGKQNEKPNVPTLIAQVRATGRTEKRMFQQPVIAVGRGHENDIVIFDHRVSRQHAIFYLDEKGVSVKDLGSSNGLRIGKEYIHNQQMQLKQGDIVRFSNGDDLVILVQWQMQPLQAENTITETVGTLEKLFWLYESSFLRKLKPNALIELACHATVRIYRPQEEICKMGAPALEFIVLIDGEVMILPNNNAPIAATGQTIGGLEILTHTNYTTTVVAARVRTRALTIKAKDLEAMLSHDPLLTRNILEMVSHRLKESLGQTTDITQI